MGLSGIRTSSPVNLGQKYASLAVQAKTTPEGGLMARLDPTEHQRFVWASLAEVMAKKVANIELDFTTPELVATILQAFDQLEHK